MKYLLVFLLMAPLIVASQTKTTEDLDKRYSGISLFFYKNTLRMINQREDKEFDEVVKEIEKMRFMMIDKHKHRLSATDYVALKRSYEREDYDVMMSGRMDGRNFDMLVREDGGRVKGTVVLVSDSASLIVMDILGRIALDKAATLFKTIDENTDAGKIMSNVLGNGKEKGKRKPGSAGAEQQDGDGNNK